MFCYIKYSVAQINNVRLVSSELSAESFGRRGKLKTRADFRRASIVESPRFLEHQSNTAFDLDQGMTGQLVHEMSMAVIKQKQPSPPIEIPEEDVNCVVQSSSFLSGLSEKSMGSLQKREKTVTLSTSFHPKRRGYSPTLKTQKHKHRTLFDDEYNETLMINPDCFAQILLDYIYDTLNLYKNNVVTLDLCDDSGVVMGLNELKPYESANTRLQNRNTYNLVALESDAKYNEITVIPLIAGTNAKERELIKKFKRPGPSISSSTGHRSLAGSTKLKLPKRRESLSAKI